jgi:hypothetical protein
LTGGGSTGDVCDGTVDSDTDTAGSTCEAKLNIP